MGRITLINRYFHPDESATSQLLSDLAFRLAERGWDVAVVTSRQRIDDPGASLSAVETVHGVRVHRVWTSRQGRGSLVGRALDYLTFYAAALFCLLRVVRAGDLVLAKTDPPLIGLVAVIVARLKGATAVNWWQDVYPEVAERLGIGVAIRLRGPLRRIRRFVVDGAARNVVIGRCMRDYLVAHGASDARITVIPNWVEDGAIRPVPTAANPLRSEWGLGNRFVVGYSGNLGLSHEFDALLGAARECAHLPDVRFVFIGAGAQRPGLADQCAKLGLGNVEFRPFQPRERLPLSLAVPDLHVVSLRAGLEGLIVPSKLYGALAAGRPVLFLGPESSEVARTIQEWQCGFVLADADPRSIADVIARCQAEPSLLVAMGERARKAVDARYGREAALRAWEQTLDEALCPVTASVAPARPPR